MPTKPRHQCNRVGCYALTSERYCAEHQRQAVEAYEAKRGTATERGYNATWARVRAMKLAGDPLCERCRVHGLTVAAVLVHHKDRNPRHNTAENIESLCDACHDDEHRNERWSPR